MKEDREEALTLGILNEIAGRNDVTQRHIADRLGVALGLAHSYLRRCVRKGLIKVTQAPANRYLYYLTPSGFAEKSRLTAEFLSSSFDFYRSAGAEMALISADCRIIGAQRIVFAGVSELAEIGSIRLQDAGLKLVGTLDPESLRDRFLGQPVWHSADQVEDAEAAVFTALRQDLSLYSALVNRFGEARVFVPPIVSSLATAPETKPRR